MMKRRPHAKRFAKCEKKLGDLLGRAVRVVVKFPFSLRRVVYSFAATGNLFNSVLRGHGQWGDGMDARRQSTDSLGGVVWVRLYPWCGSRCSAEVSEVCVSQPSTMRCGPRIFLYLYLVESLLAFCRTRYGCGFFCVVVEP